MLSNIGENADPWETPNFRGQGVKHNYLSTSFQVLSNKKEQNQLAPDSPTQSCQMLWKKYTMFEGMKCSLQVFVVEC